MCKFLATKNCRRYRWCHLFSTPYFSLPPPPSPPYFITSPFYFHQLPKVSPSNPILLPPTIDTTTQTYHCRSEHTPTSLYHPLPLFSIIDPSFTLPSSHRWPFASLSLLNPSHLFASLPFPNPSWPFASLPLTNPSQTQPNLPSILSLLHSLPLTPAILHITTPKGLKLYDIFNNSSFITKC